MTATGIPFKPLRDQQKLLLLNMLNFNTPKTAAEDSGLETSTWKILVLDSAGQRVMSPILKVNDLRENGVTLYLQLNSERQPIADVPAIYFVEPSPENVARICRDLKDGLYERVYLNFTHALPRSLLEDLAYHTVQTGTSGTVAKVFDQYLNFVCLEPNLFSLSQPQVHLLLNDPASSETTVDSTIDTVAGALFAVLLTVGGQPPVICSSKGTAAEVLAGKLDTRIRNYMINAKTTVLGTALDEALLLQRPVLVLLDRNFDIATPLKHVSTYNGLVHDVLGMRLNRVTVAQPEKRTFDIDASDSFWAQNAALPFPSVAENVDAALNAYKADMQQVTRTTGVQSLQDLEQDLNSSSATLTAEELKVAISVLPELSERKRMIDSHLQLSTCLLEEIKSRDLGSFFLLEQQIAEQTKPGVLEMLRKSGTAADKLRFFLVFFLAAADISRGDMIEYEAALREAGCEMNALEYAKKWKSFAKMTSEMAGRGDKGAATLDFLDRFKLGGLREAGAGIGGVLGNLVSGVRNLLPESADTLITKQIETALDLVMGSGGGGGGQTDLFSIHDSKVPRGSDRKAPLNPQRSVYNHLLVFMVGGSNYSEYNNVAEFVKKRQLKMQLTFGTTELVTGCEFLEQLSKLYRP